MSSSAKSPNIEHSSNIPPEVYYESLEGHKQVVVPSGLEISGDGLETLPQKDDPELVPQQDDKEVARTAVVTSKNPWLRSKRRLAIIILGIVVVIAAIVLGAVLGTRGRGNQSEEQTDPPNLSDESQPLLDTAIASTTCPDGRRWVFLVDSENNIRGANWSPSFRWSLISDSSIRARPRSNSPLAASCENVPAVSDNDTLIVGFGYFDNDDLISGQTLIGGSWFPINNPGFANVSGLSISRVAQPNSRLSLSASVVRSVDEPDEPNDTEVLTSGDYNSTVAVTYDGIEGSPIMTNILGDPIRDLPQEDAQAARLVNLLDQFDFGLERNTNSYRTDFNLPTGLTCVYNIPWTLPGFYTTGSSFPTGNSGESGNLILVCVGSRDIAYANYNITNLNDDNNEQIRGFHDVWFQADAESSQTLPSPFNNTDIYILPTNSRSFDFMYLAEDNRLVLIRYLLLQNEATLVTTSTFELPNRHFAATQVQGSSEIFVYYNENSTHFAERTFNLESTSWSAAVFVSL